MRIRCVTGLIMLLVLSLASCREGRWRTFGLSAEDEEMLRLDLSLADSLMEESPDSSMSILRRDSALVCHAGMEYRVMYNLLRTQADDKLYVTHKSDSVIREAAEYFSVNGNARQQAQAWYLLGRVSYDLHHASTAMSAFRHVLSVKDESSVVCRYKSRSFAWLGTIYEKDKMYKNLLACSRQAYHYAERSDYASDLMAYALRDIGRSLSYLKDNEKAITYYKKALKTARQATDDELFKTIENELSAIYIEEGQLHNAEKILLRPMKWTSNEDLAPYYYTTGKYYETKGDIDSAVFYYKKNIAIASMYSKTLTAAHLVDLYDKYGNHVEARKYRELGKIYEDSLGLQKQIETQDNDKIVEKEMRTQNQNDELIHARRVLIAIFCLLGTVLNAEISITTIISLDCPYCKRVIKDVYNLIVHYPNRFSWKILIAEDGDINMNHKDFINHFSRQIYIYQIYKSDKDECLQALLHGGKNIKEILFAEDAIEEYRNILKSVRIMKIQHFPTILVNNYLISTEYDISDLQYISTELCCINEKFE